MAQKVSVVLVDDIDGTAAEETVGFALDGIAYEIDLSGKNAAKLRDAVAPYVGHARKVGGARRRGAAAKKVVGASAADVRAWASANGYKLAERGRVPREIQDAYEKAH